MSLERRNGTGLSRLAQIPIDHVVAEVAAFPLASVASLELGLTELSPLLSGPTRPLWREAERHTLGSFPAFSVDEAVAIRDRIWFGDRQRSGRSVPLGAYLATLAKLFLEAEGGVAVPTLPDNLHRGSHLDAGPQAARARFAWRRLSFNLPPDLLLAALDVSPRPGVIENVAATLDRMLRDRTYAELHLHLGCSLDFPTFWVFLLRALASPEQIRPNTFRSPGAQLDEGLELAHWLLSSAIVRYVLAAYLRWRQDLVDAGTLESFLATTVRHRLAGAMGPSGYALLLYVITELRRGRLSPSRPSFASLQGLYSELTHVTTLRLDDWEQAQAADPIAGLFPPLGVRRPTPEMRFVAEGLDYLKSKRVDRMFQTLFWQVVRIRALVYRHVVQRPLTPGLQWFVRFYSRMKVVAKTAGKGLLFRAAAEQGGLRSGLRSLEVRTSPDPSISKLLAEVIEVDQAASRLRSGRGAAAPATVPDFEYGMVLHFARSRSRRALEGTPDAHGLWSHSDPGSGFMPRTFGNPSGYRYAQFYKEKRQEATALAWLLWHYPIALEVVRGLDLCTDELGVPIWVFVPLIRHVRAVAKAASAYLLRVLGLEVPPLRMTVHAGEDFVHLLTGLRHVDEVGFHRGFDFRQGDRIGHGLALGVNPRGWASRAGRIPMIREDRLFDLAWEWAWYGREGSHPPGGRQSVVEQEIARLSESIFGHAYSAYQIDKLMRNVHDPEMLRRLRFPDGPLPRLDPLGGDAEADLRLLSTYLTDPQVFLRGRQIEWVDPAAEGDILAEIQAGIRRTIGEYGIAVEVNPTSNLLVGDLQDLANHPLWRLRPPRSAVDSPPVSVCIGSDDPLTFGTNLRQEYQFLHDALALAGLSDDEAFAWLDQTRASGLLNRFTLPRSPNRSITSLFRWENLQDQQEPALQPPP